MSQTCQRCYRIVHRACQNDAETMDCDMLKRPQETKTMTIKLYFSTIDNCRNVKHYKTLAGARKAAQARLGEHPEIGSTYAISGDGVVKVTVAGATLAELFPEAV